MAELQQTFGSFKLRGEVQGLQRNYAYNDDSTPNGYPKHRLQFDVKTTEDNLVRVNVEGLGFDKIRIVPKERDDNRSEDIKRDQDIPEGWEVMMGVNVGVEQDKDGKNIIKNFDNYDAALYLYNNLKDGDFVFVGGRTEFRKYTNKKEEQVVINNLNVNRLFISNGSLDQEDFGETSSFNQNIIINAVDLDKKEMKAYVSAFIVGKNFGELQTTPYQFWIDGNKEGALVNNIKKLPFGTQLRVQGKIHSKPIYQEVEVEDDGWGSKPTGFEPRNSISGVDKSYEITYADPSTLDESKYTQEDLFPPKEEIKDGSNPFKDVDNNDEKGWGSKPSESKSENTDDPFAEDTF